MSRLKMVSIDSVKLNDALSKRQLTPVEVSRRLGYSDHYIHMSMRRGALSEVCRSALESIYGINYSEYRLNVPVVVKPNDDTDSGSTNTNLEVSVNIDYDELYKCIYLATYRAMQKALQGDNS